MRTALCTLVACLALTGVAAAQPGATPIAPLAPAPAEPAPQPDYRELNPGTALALSLGVTAAGYGAAYLADRGPGDDNGLALLGAGGIILGPSFGHWYQEDVWTRGLGLRLTGVTVSMFAAVSMIDICFDDCPEEDHSTALTFFYAGAIAFAAGTIDDIVSAPLNASKRNRENRARFVKSVSLAPQLSGNQTGLVLAGTF